MEHQNLEIRGRLFKKIPKEELDIMIGNFIEIELTEPFQIIRETLTRVGVLRKGTLYQSVHILHKKGKYYLVHFKQLFELDGRDTSFTDDDRERLFKIAYLLKYWNLIDFVNESHRDIADECKEVYVNIAKVEDIREGNILLKKKYNL